MTNLERDDYIDLIRVQIGELNLIQLQQTYEFVKADYTDYDIEQFLALYEKILRKYEYD